MRQWIGIEEQKTTRALAWRQPADPSAWTHGAECDGVDRGAFVSLGLILTPELQFNFLDSCQCPDVLVTHTLLPNCACYCSACECTWLAWGRRRQAGHGWDLQLQGRQRMAVNNSCKSQCPSPAILIPHPPAFYMRRSFASCVPAWKAGLLAHNSTSKLTAVLRCCCCAAAVLAPAAGPHPP